jgi:hypothetical protein
VTRRKQRSDGPPDIEIGARASAKKLRFRRKPRTNVDFEGRTRVREEDRIEEIELDTDSHTERHNLPEEVEPGVTYRDVEVGWAARARARIERGEQDEEDDERKPEG